MAKQSQIRPGKKAPQGSNPWLPILGTLAAATPAIAVGLLGAAAVTMDRVGPPETSFYRQQAEQSIGRGDLEGYRLCLETLTRLDPSNQSWMLSLAQTLEKLDKGDGKKEKASALWTAMAPLDKPGFGPAQLEQVNRIQEKIAKSPPKEVEQQQAVYKLMEIHLRQGLMAKPGDPDMGILLADQLLAEEKPDDAQKVLESIPDIVRTPEAKSRLAAITPTFVPGAWNASGRQSDCYGQSCTCQFAIATGDGRHPIGARRSCRGSCNMGTFARKSRYRTTQNRGDQPPGPSPYRADRPTAKCEGKGLRRNCRPDQKRFGSRPAVWPHSPAIGQTG